MKLVGLTGGIATGKSTVAALLRELGAEIIDADQLAREIVEPGKEAWREIVAAFGQEILDPNNAINREKLRTIVFRNPKARQKLQAITHPRIRELARQRIRALEAAGAAVVIYDAPLLFENKVHLWLRPVILVACDLETQKQRLRDRDRLGEEEIDLHLRAQMPLDEKRKLADYVIENTDTREELRKQVEELWRKLTAAPDGR